METPCSTSTTVTAVKINVSTARRKWRPNATCRVNEVFSFLRVTAIPGQRASFVPIILGTDSEDGLTPKRGTITFALKHETDAGSAAVRPRARVQVARRPVVPGNGHAFHDAEESIAPRVPANYRNGQGCTAFYF